MQNYIVPAHMLQELIVYLEGRPFREVVGLLNQIGGLVQQQNRSQPAAESSAE